MLIDQIMKKADVIRERNKDGGKYTTGSRVIRTGGGIPRDIETEEDNLRSGWIM